MVLCDFIAMAKGWRFLAKWVKWVKSKYPDTFDAKAGKKLDHGCNFANFDTFWTHCLQCLIRVRHHPLEVLALPATVPAAWWHLKYPWHGWLVRLILICRNPGQIDINITLFAYFLDICIILVNCFPVVLSFKSASWVVSASRFRQPKFQKQAASEGSLQIFMIIDGLSMVDNMLIPYDFQDLKRKIQGSEEEGQV